MEDIKTYYCRRIKSQVCGEKMEDLSGRIVVHCKFYTDYTNVNNKLPCLLDMLHKKCLVKLAVRKEAKEAKLKLFS